MTTPHKEAILEKAKELFMENSVKNGIPAISPTESELRESGFISAAKSQLMQDRNRSAIEEYFPNEDRFNASGFRFDVKEATKTGFYVSGTSGIGKSDIAMNAAKELMKHGVSVVVFDSTMDWIERSNIPSYITVKPNVQFSFALDGRSFIFDIHLLNPDQRLELLEYFSGVLYRHQAFRLKNERKKFIVILEESQTFLYQGVMRSVKTRNIRMLLSEGRNFNVRFGSITQFSSMLDKDAMKFMKQRYVGWTDEPNDIVYVTNMMGGYKERVKSLRAGQFLYKHGNDVSMIEIEPYASDTKPQPLLIQAEPFARNKPIRTQAKALEVPLLFATVAGALGFALLIVAMLI